MVDRNWTLVTEFILLGLTDDPRLQIPLFVLFLLFYVIIVLGNISIMAFIRISPRLHTPMYFLLSNLAFIDLCFASVTTPNMLANFLSKKKAIPLLGCVTQMFLFTSLGSTEVCVLAVMSYDRYMAICQPLLYNVVMTKVSCIYLSAGAYLLGFFNGGLHTGLAFRLPFCGSNRITHFYCDIPPLLKLACSDTTLNVAVLFSVGGCVSLGSFTLIVISYTYIVSAILRISSTDGRHKAFSTCSSHLFCVLLFYVTTVFTYLRPTSSYSLEQDRVASVFYTVVIPMLNPFIYSLRNKEVKEAMQNAIANRFAWRNARR